MSWFVQRTIEFKEDGSKIERASMSAVSFAILFVVGWILAEVLR